MTKFRLLTLLFFIVSCTHILAQDVDSEEEEEEDGYYMGLYPDNPAQLGTGRGDNVEMDMEEFDNEEPQMQAMGDPEEQQEAEEEALEAAEELEEAALEEAEEAALEIAEQEEVDAEEMEEPEYESSSPSQFSSIGVGGSMVNPANQQDVGTGVAEVEEEDLSEEDAAALGGMGAVGGEQNLGGVTGDSSEEVMGAGGSIGSVGGSIGYMGSSFSMSPVTTGPPLVRITTQNVTPEPILGNDAAGGIAAAETSENLPQEQTMSKKKTTAIAAGAGAAGVVGIAAVGAGLAFKAGLIGGGAGNAAAAGGAAAV
ncbi:PE-PGRS family protein PE_PGRS16-like [Lytechinus variegatus]|uniref:PE-PGRS family protein PE_PGRS16-like n=1 Tax=Lytechinus variegatus TaxID=7654 RepID=UPI001BB14DE6|nr:PE-PGRS family protein PE_PGRS16-like [Lytechinus variegatus]